jgi:hypothetical protein
MYRIMLLVCLMLVLCVGTSFAFGGAVSGVLGGSAAGGAVINTQGHGGSAQSLSVAGNVSFSTTQAQGNGSSSHPYTSTSFGGTVSGNYNSVSGAGFKAAGGIGFGGYAAGSIVGN